MIFTIFNGLASIERGFSVNKEVSDTNMHERTIISHRIVLDSVNNILDGRGKEVHKIDIDKEMMKYCRGAGMRYEEHLAERKSTQKNEEKESKK